jgi:hypothetical protein
VHQRVRGAGGREQAHLRRAETPSGLDERHAGPGVLAAGPDVLALGVAGADPDDVPDDLGVLDRHDGVGAGRDRRAGRDTDRLAPADGRVRSVPDHGPADDP